MTTDNKLMTTDTKLMTTDTKISSPGKLDMKNCKKINRIEINISAHRTEYIYTIFCSSY